VSNETRELAAFLDTGLDLSTDTATEGERERTLAWYREHHDHGELDLAPFIRYQMNHDPASFKRLRRHLFALGREPEDRPLPIVAAVLLYVYSYAVLGNGKGTLYEIVAARALGVTRAQTIETLALATLQGGPLAVNAFAEYCDDYVAEWPEDEGGVRWPDGWAPDVASLRSGIDLDSDVLEEGELELIRGWYERMTRSVPAHLELLGELAPDALKTQRARFETAVRGALPAQLVPLLEANLHAIRLQSAPLRRSLLLARSLGVRRGEALATLFWAAVYGGDVVMETAIDAVADVLADWP
jgi:hypothetical protein